MRKRLAKTTRGEEEIGNADFILSFIVSVSILRPRVDERAKRGA